MAVATVQQHRKRLGRNVRTYRKLAGLSQEKLAELANLHRNYIGEVERGEKTISIDALTRIAKAVGVKLTDLVDGV